MSATNETERPIVFICSKCNAIVGDSVSWISAHEELSSVTLCRVSDKVLVGDMLTMSPDGIEAGSTYKTLRCGSCSEDIGRIYKTTPEGLDELRNMFSLDVKKVDSYQLGSGKQTHTDEDNSPVVSVCRHLIHLSEQFKKMQSLIVNMNSKIAHLERLAKTAS